LGDKLQGWIRKVIASRVNDACKKAKEGESRAQLSSRLKGQNGVLTFKELKALSDAFLELGIKNICFTGTNCTDKTLEIFDYERTPDMPIDLAIRISVSIPWFFESVKYNGKEYIDGGCLENYPMTVFDQAPYFDKNNRLITGVDGQNLCTLGFRVDSQEEMRTIMWDGAKKDETGWLNSLLHDVKDWCTKIAAGVDVAKASKATDKQTYGRYAQRTVQIPDMGYSTFNFDLEDKDKDKLKNAGYNAAKEWFGLYYDDTGIEIEVDKIDELAFYLSVDELADAEQRLNGLIVNDVGAGL
jgi:NTE family protein